MQQRMMKSLEGTAYLLLMFLSGGWAYFFQKPILHVILDEHIDEWMEDVRNGPKELCVGRFFPRFVDANTLINKRISRYERYVQQVRQRLNGIDSKDISIYQEAISVEFPKPGTQRYREIVDKLISETPKHFPHGMFTTIALPLMQGGATLLGIEDKQLMNKCGEALKKGELESSIFDQNLSSHRSIVERDRFIARQISMTLKQGKVGVLLIGGAHKVEAYIPWYIKVKLHEDIYQNYMEALQKEF